MTILHPTTADKTLRINLDTERYGAFAEIGAGQEVARHFFLAGKASQTIAKSMSAYDMIYSDEIYGKEKSGRYVVEPRLFKMLEKEYALLQRRLAAHRGDKTAFFAYANTVATGTPETPRCHGWMGVQFQARPNGPTNTIILHVRMMDRRRLQQQQALGVLGVNLIEAAFYGLNEPDKFIDRLTENLKKDQLNIDVLKFDGPDLKAFDNRTLNFNLVAKGVSEAVMIAPDKNVLNIADMVHGKALLFQRSSYCPLTKTHMDVLEKGLKQMGSDALPILELTLPPSGTIDTTDYLKRIDMISAMGYHTLVSQFHLFYQLKNFFRRYSQKPIGLVTQASKLEKIFDEAHYKNLEGGILEGLGKLLDPQTKLFVYPYKTEQLCMTSKTFFPAKQVAHLYKHFTELGQIVDIAGCDETQVYTHSGEVRKMIANKDKAWEQLVPPPVAKIIQSS